jgi:hypothetical protein
MISAHIENIKKAIEPLRQEIIHHKVYSKIRDLEDLKIFMQYHVFAVWDFMSLLKALQSSLTCTTVPWFPKGSAETRFLINEIVLGEESDIDLAGVRKSHFELYLDAMEQCGADTSKINTFIDVVKKTGDFDTAFAESATPKEAMDFVRNTFKIIDTQKDYLQSAIFTFGREDLIPGMFISIINEIHKKFPNDISVFKYYIERHIEIDGDHHSQLALQMTSKLCKDNQELWMEVEEAVVQSLQRRIELWNGVYNALS